MWETKHREGQIGLLELENNCKVQHFYISKPRGQKRQYKAPTLCAKQ